MIAQNLFWGSPGSQLLWSRAGDVTGLSVVGFINEYARTNWLTCPVYERKKLCTNENIMLCLLLLSVCRLKSMSSDQPTKKKQQISVTAAGCFTYWRMKLSWCVVCRLAPAADVQNHWPRAVLLPSPTSFSSPRRGRFVTCWAGELKWAMDGNMNLTAVPSLREEWKQLCFLYIFL